MYQGRNLGTTALALLDLLLGGSGIYWWWMMTNLRVNYAYPGPSPYVNLIDRIPAAIGASLVFAGLFWLVRFRHIALGLQFLSVLLGITWFFIGALHSLWPAGYYRSAPLCKAHCRRTVMLTSD